MLFLPKYGTICVCAAAAVAKPATSAAATSATAEERVGSCTRVRMGKYLGKGDSWSEAGCDLTVTAGRLQTPCSTILSSCGLRCPLPTAGPTPLGDKTYILVRLRVLASRARFGGTASGLTQPKRGKGW